MATGLQSKRISISQHPTCIYSQKNRNLLFKSASESLEAASFSQHLFLSASAASYSAASSFLVFGAPKTLDSNNSKTENFSTPCWVHSFIHAEKNHYFVANNLFTII